jgi:WD40 repeat protein
MTNKPEHAIIPYHNEIFTPKSAILAQKGLALIHEKKTIYLDIYKDGRQLFPGIDDRICAYYSKNDSSLWVTNFGMTHKPKQLWEIHFDPYFAQEILSAKKLAHDDLNYYRDLRRPNKSVYCIAAINNELLFYGINNEHILFVNILDYKKGNEIHKLMVQGTLLKICISDDKEIVAVGTACGVYVFGLKYHFMAEDPQVIRWNFTASKGDICHISIIHDKKIALIGGDYQGLLCLDLSTMNIIKDFGAKKCTGICVNKEKSLALTSDEVGVKLLNLSDFSIINQWPYLGDIADTYSRQVIDFSPDGKYAIARGGNGLLIWSLYTGQIIYDISTSKICDNGEKKYSPLLSGGFSVEGNKVYLCFFGPGDVWEIDIPRKS